MTWNVRGILGYTLSDLLNQIFKITNVPTLILLEECIG